MTRHTGPSAAVLALVKARNGGLCLRCSRRPGEQCHHRIPRGMGGSHDPKINQPPNLTWVCADCHAAIESYRTRAYGDGWLVRRGADPAEIPLITIYETMVILLPNGSVVSNSLAGINEGPTPW